MQCLKNNEIYHNKKRTKGRIIVTIKNQKMKNSLKKI